MRPATNERLRRGLELYRFRHGGGNGASLQLVRDLTGSNDVLNAAEWQPTLGGCILYGTDTGRTVSLSFTREGEVDKDRDDGGKSRSPSATDEATFGRPWPAPQARAVPQPLAPVTADAHGTHTSGRGNIGLPNSAAASGVTGITSARPPAGAWGRPQRP